MANTEYTTRALSERIDLYDTHGRAGSDLTAAGSGILSALTVLWAGIAIALLYAAADVFEGWGHAVVVGVIVAMFLAIANWTYSLRAGNPLPSAGAPSRGCGEGESATTV